jgi:hypothetical protein
VNGPETKLMELIVDADVPILVMAKDCTWLEVPASCSGNVTELADESKNCAGGGMLKGACDTKKLCGLPAPLLVTVRVVGLTMRKHSVPGVSIGAAPQFPPSTFALVLPAILLMTRLASPTFLSTTIGVKKGEALSKGPDALRWIVLTKPASTPQQGMKTSPGLINGKSTSPA